jgi:hypothetical protein
MDETGRTARQPAEAKLKHGDALWMQPVLEPSTAKEHFKNKNKNETAPDAASGSGVRKCF